MFEERLEKLHGRIDGAAAVALVSQDGLTVESRGGSDEGLDLEALAAETLDQIRVISDSQSGPALGRVRHFSMGTDRLTLMASALSAGYYLLLVMKSGTPSGRARFELRRAVLEFEKDLY